MNVLGVMSGSSLDGLDVVVVNFNGNDFNVKKASTVPLPVEMVERLKKFDSLSALDFIQLDTDYANTCATLIKQSLEGMNVELMGFHGHTTVHIPHKGITHQLGNGGILAAALGIDVVTDFRIQDVTKGGEGTPLVSIFDLNYFSGRAYYLNLGGIANITDVDKNVAFDICPFNQVMNFFCRKYANVDYDASGNIALKGKPVTSLINAMNKFKYWQSAPPKSLDNTWIRDIFIPKIDIDGIPLEDLLASFVEWSTDQISSVVSHKEETKMFITGGGVHNSFFVERLQEKLKQKGCMLDIPSKEMIDFKEAILMAYLAYLRYKETHNVLSSITNAHSDTIAGAYYKC